MHHPTTLTALTALAALTALSAASPNGARAVKSAPDGPNKLDECGCWPIYQKMLTCQKLAGPNSGIRECVCIPNPDGWYTSMNGCRACLSPGSYDDNDFFDNLSRTITQLFVSCTEKGGGISSDGESICASNAYHQACASLKTSGQPSWASYEVFKGGENGNGTYVLDIAEYQEHASTTDTAASTTTTTSATTAGDSAAATETSVTTTTAVTLPPATGVRTTSASSTATSSSSSAMAPAVSGLQAMGLVMVAGAGAVLF